MFNYMNISKTYSRLAYILRGNKIGTVCPSARKVKRVKIWRRVRLGAAVWAPPIGCRRLGAGYLGTGHLGTWTIGRQNSNPI